MTIANEYIEIEPCPNCENASYVMPRADVAICANCNKQFKVILHVPGTSYNASWIDSMDGKMVWAKNVDVPPALVINRVKK